MFYKILAICLSLLFLTSCGMNNSQNVSIYTCEQMIKDGKSISADDLFPTCPVLTLSDNGKATLELNGEVCDCTWSGSGGEFTLKVGDRSSSGTLEDGVCTLDLFNQDVIYVFCAENSALPEKQEKGMKNKRWSGSWYGYWKIFNSSGEWENLDGQYFDCFAVIDMSVDNSGEMTLWDENSSMSSPLSRVNLKLAPSSSGFGTARSESGYFFSGDISKGEWSISPDGEELENLISFSSRYSGAEGEFDYEIILRPWGYIWDDALENEYFRLPYYYNQWYIPMLNGKYSMPESFEP